MKKILIFIFAFFLVLSFGLNKAEAGTTDLSGWAWSSNIGWISFNSQDAGAGGGPYVVKVSTTTNSTIGDVSGWAWSSNIGWIKFGGLSDFPGNGGNAIIDFTDGKVTGWARACAGTLSGICSTMESRTDGWDGWISLSGTKYESPDTTDVGGKSAKGITLGIDKNKPEAYGKLTGYAWGGDVVGWITFSPIAGIPNTGVTVCDPDCGGGGGGSPAFTINANDNIRVNKTALASADSYVTVSGGSSGDQIIDVTLGTFTAPSGINVTLREANGSLASSGKITCEIGPSKAPCQARVHLFIEDTGALANVGSLNVPVVGTRTSPVLASNNVLTDDAGFLLDDSQSNNLSLWLVQALGAGVYDTTKKLPMVTIKEGSEANVAWSAMGVEEDSCFGVNNGPDNSTILDTVWESAQLNSRENTDPFVISGLSKGNYNLSLRCEADGEFVDTNQVLIKVIKSEESHF